MNIAYAGASGAFAHEACLAFAPEREPTALASFAAVVSAVECGEVEQGMLPVRNSRAGEVAEVAALLANRQVAIVGQRELKVRLHLLGLPSARSSHLKIVTSHPMALRQCALSIDRLGLATREAPNTAMAARDLREKHVAVLASEASAEAYGLQVLEWDLQDDPENATTFVIIEPVQIS